MDIIEKCCWRDDDGDGNCYLHSSPGVLRAKYFGSEKASPVLAREIASNIMDIITGEIRTKGYNITEILNWQSTENKIQSEILSINSK